MLEAFKEKQDVHRLTAIEIFGAPAESVTEEQRRIAKAINFGLIYGKTAFGLSQELGIPRKDAQEYIDRYFQRYSKVKEFMSSTIEQARLNGYTRTLFGRQRPIRDLASKNVAVRNNAERMAMNAPVQGTAADIMKIAMIRVAQSVDLMGGRIVLQVHDELILEVPEDQAAAAQDLLIREMSGAAYAMRTTGNSRAFDSERPSDRAFGRK